MEPLLLKLLYRILAEAGYLVLAASTAEQALEIEREFRGIIELLITSASLTSMSGSELAKRLQATRSRLPVIIISSDAVDAAIAYHSGWHYLQKPFLPDALLDCVASVHNRAVGP
jgi:DNA-binding response OmpR family regulator